MKILLSTILMVCAAFWTISARAVTLLGLGDLPGGITYSSALGVSADGSVVVGESLSTKGYEAFQWTVSNGMTGLGDLPDGGFWSRATATSADGSVVVGYGDTASGFEAFRWTITGGMVGLGRLTTHGWSKAYGISADGSIVGYSDSVNGFEAFRWNAADGMVGLGDVPGGSFWSMAYGVSADGSVVVGQCVDATGFEAFRWTAAGGMASLGDLPGGGFACEALGASADGSVIVGQGAGVYGYEAFRWTSTQGMTGLGDLPGGNFQSAANGVSADGSVVVGYGSDANGSRAFVWDAAHGMRPVTSVLTAAGVDLTGWRLTNATAINADGTVIVGEGIHNGGMEAWIAILKPNPSVSITGKRKITTRKAKFVVTGTATDAAKIEVKVGKTAYRPAVGGARWSFTAKLRLGPNTIVSRAVDVWGVISPTSKVTITRR